MARDRERQAPPREERARVERAQSGTTERAKSRRSEQGEGSRIELEEGQARDVERRTAPPVAVVHQAISAEGEEELQRPLSALFWSGLAAGLSMGFSLVTEGLLRAALPDTDWRRLVAKLGYSVGFLIVILGRQQLFTENTLTPILPLLERKSTRVLGRVLRLWGVVLFTNILGAFIFAVLIARTDAFSEHTRQAFAAIGRDSLGTTFGTTFIRAIFAGWLIALMLWLLPYAEAARFFVIVVITYVVALGQLAHIVAGSVETLFLVAAGDIGLGTYFTRFFVPTLLGNVIGGVALVAAINHAQTVAGRHESPAPRARTARRRRP